MKSYRPQRVANVIREIVSEALTSKLNDPRISTLSSVTRVEVSPDLENAKVYISVIGNPAEGRKTMSGLSSATGLVQRMIARELSVRQCPRVTFHLDESIKRGNETLRIINEAMAEIEDQAGDHPADDAVTPRGLSEELGG